MLRAAVWTMGLFGAGAAVSRLYGAGWVEPLVLVVLGVAFLFVSRAKKADVATVRTAPAEPLAATQKAPVAAAVPVPATIAATTWPAQRGPAPVGVTVEQSA